MATLSCAFMWLGLRRSWESSVRAHVLVHRRALALLHCCDPALDGDKFLIISVTLSRWTATCNDPSARMMEAKDFLTFSLFRSARGPARLEGITVSLLSRRNSLPNYCKLSSHERRVTNLKQQPNNTSLANFPFSTDFKIDFRRCLIANTLLLMKLLLISGKRIL